MGVGNKFGVVVAVAALAVVAQSPASSALMSPRAATASIVAAAEGGSPEVTAMARAVETGQPVEVAEWTDERTKVVADPETGQFTAELNAFPVRVKRDNAWRDVDLSLVRGADGTVRSRQGYADVSLSGGGTAPLFTLGGGGSDTGLAWDGALPVPDLDGTKATYAEVLPGVDLVAKVGVDGVATYLVVKSREAATNPKVKDLKYKVVGSATQARATSSGGEIRDASGAVKFTVQRANMWDSKGSPAGLESHERVSPGQGAREVSVPIGATSDVLSVDVDEALLQAPETVYPVIIDPEIPVAREYTYWVAVQSNGTNYHNSSTEHARVGRMNWQSPYFTSRAYYNFNTSVLYGKTIGSAVFSHKLIHSPNWDCNAATYGPGVMLGVTNLVGSSTAWPGPGTSSNNYGWLSTIGTNAKAHGDSDLCTSYDVVEWNAKTAVQTYAANVSKPTLTLGLKSSNESDGAGWRKFDNDATLNYPLLSVTYNSRPNTPGAPLLVGATGTGKSNYWVDQRQVTLKAVVTDPDGTAGGLLHGKFEISKGAAPIIASGYGSSVLNGQQSVWSSPAGLLEENTLYTVRVWGRDAMGAESQTYSDYIQFRVDTMRPVAPTAAKAAESYAVGGAAPVQIDWTDPDIAQVCYSRNTDVVSNCQAVSATTRSAIVETAPTGLESNAPQTVWVKTVDAAGKSSDTVTTAFPVTAEGPSGIWHLDGDGVDTAGTVNLSSTGAPTYVGGYFGGSNDGVLDRGASLNGSTQSLPSATAAVRTGSSFSISAWVKFDPARNSDPYQFAVSQTNTNYAGAYLGEQQGKAVFGTRTGDLAADTHQFAMAPTVLPALEWVHLAGVYNAGAQTSTLYINGEAVTTITVTTATSAQGPFTIGRSKSAGAATHYWGGDVDEVAVFPRVISLNTVRGLMLSRPANPKSGA